MEDLIKRSDAIKAMQECFSVLARQRVQAVKMIEAIPSADRPQGYYIKGENGEWYCSNCKRIDDKYSVANFCWYCGARMKGADDAVDAM